MPIKFDMGKAWNDAVALMQANTDVILVVAGVFFFLPNALFGILVQPPEELMAMQSAGAQANPEAMLEAFSSYYGEIWWIMLLVSLAQAIGLIGLLALLVGSQRPTVGEALTMGLKGVLPYIIAQLLITFGIGIIVVLLVAVGATINAALAILLGLIGAVLAVYAYVKFSLVAPAIGIEGRLNPLAAMMRSWKLTKGNSFRLFAFYFLLLLVIVVLALIATTVLGIFGAFGDQIGLFASAIGSGIISMAVTSVMAAVLAAIHSQLSGGSGADTAATFD